MPGGAEATEWVHASCVALDGAGILIRGASGSGKSTLALLLLDRADLANRQGRLVGDDRVGLDRAGDRVLARPHPALDARIEVRGLGLARVAAGAAPALLRLVVDLVETAPRLPDDPMPVVRLLGLALPGLVLDRAIRGSGLAPRLVLDALAACPGVARGSHEPLLSLPPGPGP